jgi:hypothetical protein
MVIESAGLMNRRGLPGLPATAVSRGQPGRRNPRKETAPYRISRGRARLLTDWFI